MPAQYTPGPSPREAGALTGSVLEGRYAVGAVIGRGGMAEVYLGRHLGLDRACAIKVLHPGHAADADARARFEREAAAASRVDHPNVCRTWDFGRTSDGLDYLVLEYLEGQPLSSLLEAGPLSVPRALAITRQSAAGLQAAHDAGVVHRDMKPSNVLLTTRGGAEAAVLVDFGLARPVRGSEVTRDGLMVGTPEVMSPEQITGDAVGPASDQYQLALLLVRMLTGTVPFPGGTAQDRMLARLTQPPARLAELRPGLDLPPGVEQAVTRALSRDPGRRFPRVTDFAQALGGPSLPGADAPTEVLARGSRGTRPAPRARWGPLLGLGLVLALGLLLWPEGKPSPGANGPEQTDSAAGAALVPSPPPAGLDPTREPLAPAPAPGGGPIPTLPADDLVFSDDPVDRVGAREQAERVYRSGEASDTLRAEAAFMVAETYRREGAVASARLWLQRCLDLQERPGCRRLLSQLP